MLLVRRFRADRALSINLGFSKIRMVPEPTLGLLAHSGADFHDIEVGRTLMLQAGHRGIAHRARQVPLAFLDCGRIVGRGHRVLAEAGIIQLFDVHRAMLPTPVAQERRLSGTV
jgi:hypothetical protein